MTEHTRAATIFVLEQINVNLTAQLLALKGVVEQVQEIVKSIQFSTQQVKGVESVMRDDGEPK